MDEGIVKGCEDSSYAEHQLAIWGVSFGYIHGELEVSYHL